MHATLAKFGYPHSLLREFEHWCILLRPAQVTLGSLVHCAKCEATSFGALPAAAHAELHACTKTIEQALATFHPYDKLNYLALMMVDPHVHFHVLPRYAAPPVLQGQTFPDTSWPGPPDLKSQLTLTDNQRQHLFTTLLDAFTKVV